MFTVRFLFLFMGLMLLSCSNKEGIQKYELSKINKALNAYFLHRNASSEYFTDIKKMEPISYKEIQEEEKENSNEVYEARVYFVALITMTDGGSRKYDISDTISCFLDENFNVLRLKQ